MKHDVVRCDDSFCLSSSNLLTAWRLNILPLLSHYWLQKKKNLIQELNEWNKEKIPIYGYLICTCYNVSSFMWLSFWNNFLYRNNCDSSQIRILLIKELQNHLMSLSNIIPSRPIAVGAWSKLSSHCIQVAHYGDVFRLACDR